jgi:hypothetical protein
MGHPLLVNSPTNNGVMILNQILEALSSHFATEKSDSSEAVIEIGGAAFLIHVIVAPLFSF